MENPRATIGRVITITIETNLKQADTFRKTEAMKNLIQFAILIGSLLTTSAQEPSEFVAYLWGANEVPMNQSGAQAQGLFSLDGNALSFEIGIALGQPLSPTGLGVYGPAARGTNGDLILESTSHTIFVPLDGRGGGIAYYGGGIVTEEEISELQAGLWYVNIKSTKFPTGEIRGQICPLVPDSDCDTDGVPNKDDLCPNTPPGAVVDGRGCSIEELVPCNGPWKNHHEYVKEVKEEAFRFWKEHRLTAHERNAIVKQAEHSNCGNPPPHPVPGPVTGPIVFPGRPPTGGFPPVPPR